jgi:UDP-N-acetyl-D-glucosamine/UDP-N-acetyl-D-galactosamine dehydrogenase
LRLILNNDKIAIIGLGYVGLPLAVEFGKINNVIGFDINKSRIEELKVGNDSTLEVESEELSKAIKLTYTYNKPDLANCNIFIITVPTLLIHIKNLILLHC